MNKILSIINYDINVLADRAATYNVDSDPDVVQLAQKEKSIDRWQLILIIIALFGAAIFGLTFVKQFSGYIIFRVIGAIIMGLAFTIERIVAIGEWSVFADRLSLKQLKTADITFYNIAKNHQPTCYIKEDQDEYCTVVVTVEYNNKVDSQPILFYKKKSSDVNVLTLDVLNKTVLEPVLNG